MNSILTPPLWEWLACCAALLNAELDRICRCSLNFRSREPKGFACQMGMACTGKAVSITPPPSLAVGISSFHYRDGSAAPRQLLDFANCTVICKGELIAQYHAKLQLEPFSVKTWGSPAQTACIWNCSCDCEVSSAWSSCDSQPPWPWGSELSSLSGLVLWLDAASAFPGSFPVWSLRGKECHYFLSEWKVAKPVQIFIFFFSFELMPNIKNKLTWIQVITGEKNDHCT